VDQQRVIGDGIVLVWLSSRRGHARPDLIVLTLTNPPLRQTTHFPEGRKTLLVDYVLVNEYAYFYSVTAVFQPVSISELVWLMEG
jgi:hypothetical protein